MPAGTIAPEVLAALARGATVLTANQRAARALRHAYNDTPHPTSTWAAPEIYALETWLSTLWHQLIVAGAETALLLNRTQEHALWRTILAADRDLPPLHPIDALAELASRAFHLLALHSGLSRLRDYADSSTDARAFGRWSSAFQRACARNSYLTEAQLPAALEAALTRGNLPVPDAGLTLVDFGPLSPAMGQLFESIERAGYPVEHLRTTTPTPSATLYPAPDDPSELRAAAVWARDRLTLNPTQSVAIVTPGLADRRATLERTFSSILATNPAAQPVFEFSLGTSLGDTALAASALDLLRWTLEALPLDRISVLLLSPFLVPPAELPAAAEFDAYDLRTHPLLLPQLSLEAFLPLLRGSSRLARLRTLQASLLALTRAAASHRLAESVPRSHANWAVAFRELLQSANWSLATELDSTTYQARRRWESALDELATLDFDGTRVLPAGALQSLTRIVRQTIFAPQSRQAPIQILGPLELGGIPFDALWFLSADDSSWPPTPSANPLIPWNLQRDLGIAGAGPSQDIAAAQALTQRIAGFAAEVVFSYAAHADEGERRPSPMLALLNLTTLLAEQSPPSDEHLPLETYPDDEPLPQLPPGVISGGAQLLQLQAACAFRAFAERRLFAAVPDSRQPGLDARDRGSIVHRVMQTFWERVESQANLSSLTTPERDAILGECIDHALHRHTRSAQTAWGVAYLDVQRRRLHALLTPWLQFELGRPFFHVDAQETELPEARIGPLTLSLRVDRIDHTAEGPLILDYKTGAAAPSDWLGERPDAPQLPLYAVLTPNLAGVAFANLRAGGDLCLKGFADSSAVLDKPTRNSLLLPDQCEEWSRILTALATAFAEGDTRVEPKSYPETCKYCAQRTLCRLDPLALQDFAGEEDDPPGTEAIID